MNAQGDTSRRIVFDQVEIDLIGHRLFVDGREVALERKAFAVLVLLAREPGRVFSRDEILDAVWEHRHVTPGVLNRIITLLRHALGESADAHRYVQTVHGVGYRFDAEVRYMGERESRNAQAEETTFENEADKPPVADIGEVANESKREPNVGVHATRTGVVALLILVAAVLLTSIALRYWPMRSNDGARHEAPVLVVLPLRPVGKTANQATLAEGLSEELITRLAHIEGLRVISTASAIRAQADKLDSNGLAQQLHASHVLEGSLLQEGNELRVDLRLVELASGRLLWAQSYNRELTHVLALERDIAQAVAHTLALRLGLGPRMLSAPDTDPTLFRDYLEARRIAQGRSRDRGVAMLRAIIARTPDYAPAHATLARLLASNLRYYPAPGADIAEAKTEAARAEALEPNLAETQTARAILACRDANWDKCVRLFKRALAIDPTDSDCRTTYAYWLAGIGYVDAALEQAQIAWESDPLSSNVNFVLARLLDTVGRHREAERYLKGTVMRNPYPRWFNAVWRRKFDEAEKIAESMPESEGFRESYLEVTKALQDPAAWPPARAAIEKSEIRSGARFNVTRVLMPHSDIPHVIAGIEHMLRVGWPSYYLLLWMPEYTVLRRAPAFQDFLQRTHIIDYWNAYGWPPQCHPADGKAVCA